MKLQRTLVAKFIFILPKCIDHKSFDNLILTFLCLALISCSYTVAVMDYPKMKLRFTITTGTSVAIIIDLLYGLIDPDAIFLIIYIIFKPVKKNASR